MNDLGRTLLVLGLMVAAIGIGMMLLPKIPWLGHLPGDVYVEGGRFSFYLPIVTCLVVSAIVTLLLNLFSRH